MKVAASGKTHVYFISVASYFIGVRSLRDGTVQVVGNMNDDGVPYSAQRQRMLQSRGDKMYMQQLEGQQPC